MRYGSFAIDEEQFHELSGQFDWNRQPVHHYSPDVPFISHINFTVDTRLTRYLNALEEFAVRCQHEDGEEIVSMQAFPAHTRDGEVTSIFVLWNTDEDYYFTEIFCGSRQVTKYFLAEDADGKMSIELDDSLEEIARQEFELRDDDEDDDEFDEEEEDGASSWNLPHVIKELALSAFVAAFEAVGLAFVLWLGLSMFAWAFDLHGLSAWIEQSDQLYRISYLITFTLMALDDLGVPHLPPLKRAFTRHFS